MQLLTSYVRTRGSASWQIRLRVCIFLTNGLDPCMWRRKLNLGSIPLSCLEIHTLSVGPYRSAWMRIS